MDIGSHAREAVDKEGEVNTILGSSEQELLAKVEEQIGLRQVTQKDLEGVPYWLVKRAMDREVTENWSEVTKDVGEEGLPNEAHILSTHFVFKIKKTENGKRTLKARLVVHGNRDDEKDEVTK